MAKKCTKEKGLYLHENHVLNRGKERGHKAKRKIKKTFLMRPHTKITALKAGRFVFVCVYAVLLGLFGVRVQIGGKINFSRLFRPKIVLVKS